MVLNGRAARNKRRAAAVGYGRRRLAVGFGWRRLAAAFCWLAAVGGLRRLAAVYNGQIKTPPNCSAAFRVGGWRRLMTRVGNHQTQHDKNGDLQKRYKGLSETFQKFENDSLFACHELNRLQHDKTGGFQFASPIVAAVDF